MHLKVGRTIALVAIVAILPGIAAGGAVQIGMLSSAKSDDWICGENVPLSAPNSQSSCESAKFGECSECGVLAARNQSNVPVKLSIKIVGSGFAQPCSPGAVIGFQKCASGASVRVGTLDKCGNGFLQPGQGRTLGVAFCPDRAGVSHGEVRVSVTESSGKPNLEVFNLAGFGDYTPELAAADEARRSQLDELMKIPYVQKVELDTKSSDTAINVEVTEDDKIEQVRRLVPPKIDGYRTEVTTYISVGCAY
jgi:hypothetical protein